MKSKFFNKLLTLVLAVMMLCVPVFAACGGDNPPEETPPDDTTPPVVATVSAVNIIDKVKYDGLELESDGLPFVLSAQVTGENLTETGVTWSSSDTAKAIVSATGSVQSLAPGSATITATSKADTTKKDSITVTVAQYSDPWNGRFEKVIAGMTGFEQSTGWGIYTNSATPGEISTEVAYKGLRSFKAVNAKDATHTQGNYMTIWQGTSINDYADIMTGDYVKLRAYVYSPVANAGIRPKLMLGSATAADVKTDLVATSAVHLAEANKWTLIETVAARIPDNCATLNAQVEFHDEGTCYIDHIEIVPAVSNNANLTWIKADGEVVTGFSSATLNYRVSVENFDNLPVITAQAQESEADISITQATEDNNYTATVVVTAYDGTTVKTYSVIFFVPEDNALTDLKVSGTTVLGFDSDKLDYYILLDRGTTTVPTVTYATTASDVVLTEALELPGETTIVVGTDITRTYTVYFDVIADNRLMIPYQDTNFDGLNNYQGGTQGASWGFYGAEIVNDEIAHSGISSIKANAGLDNGGWMGHDTVNNTAANSPNYPVLGDKIKVGVWVYVATTDGLEASDTYGGRILVAYYEHNGPITLTEFTYNIQEEDIGKWIYIETEFSTTAISESASYGQIIVKNFSNSIVYFDDIALFREITE